MPNYKNTGSISKHNRQLVNLKYDSFSLSKLSEECNSFHRGSKKEKRLDWDLLAVSRQKNHVVQINRIMCSVMCFVMCKSCVANIYKWHNGGLWLDMEKRWPYKYKGFREFLTRWTLINILSSQSCVWSAVFSQNNFCPSCFLIISNFSAWGPYHVCGHIWICTCETLTPLPS